MNVMDRFCSSYDVTISTERKFSSYIHYFIEALRKVCLTFIKPRQLTNKADFTRYCSPIK